MPTHDGVSLTEYTGLSLFTVLYVSVGNNKFPSSVITSCNALIKSIGPKVFKFKDLNEEWTKIVIPFVIPLASNLLFIKSNSFFIINTLKKIIPKSNPFHKQNKIDTLALIITNHTL